jgi:hypothetical protein
LINSKHSKYEQDSHPKFEHQIIEIDDMIQLAANCRSSRHEGDAEAAVRQTMPACRGRL